MASRPSIAASLFEDILAHPGHPDTVAYLKAMIDPADPTVETEFLDFKSASVKGVPITDNDVKKTWSEALAGFATTSGGVLIWGIDARKQGGETVDRAWAINPVIDPHGLRSRLQQLHHQAADPPVPGVVIEPFPDPSDGGRGFVVCLVPESDYKPHRSEAGGKRWMMRVGDSFVDVPPPVLRSLFFPQRRSYLRVMCTPPSPGSYNVASEGSRMQFEFQIANDGPATATELVAYIRGPKDMVVHAPVHWRPNETPFGWQIACPFSIHPGVQQHFGYAMLKFPLRQQRGLMIYPPTDVAFDFRLYATDQMPQKTRLEYTVEQIQNQCTVFGLSTPLELERFG